MAKWTSFHLLSDLCPFRLSCKIANILQRHTSDTAPSSLWECWKPASNTVWKSSRWSSTRAEMRKKTAQHLFNVSSSYFIPLSRQEIWRNTYKRMLAHKQMLALGKQTLALGKQMLALRTNMGLYHLTYMWPNSLEIKTIRFIKSIVGCRNHFKVWRNQIL